MNAIRHPLILREGSLLMAILSLATALRVFLLGTRELRGDEAFGYFFSQRSPSDIVETTLALQEPHPVASYLLQHFWMAWVGHSEIALRAPGVFFSVLSVALLYLLGRRLALPVRVAAGGALFLALSPYAVWHAQDARMYNMSMALTLVSTLLMVEVFLRGGRRFRPAYVVVTWLALHTHYFAIFIVAAQNLFVLGCVTMARFAGRTGAASERPPAASVARQLWPWIQAQIVILLLYLPWLLVARATLTGYRGNGDSPGFAEMARRALAAFTVGENLPAVGETMFAALGAALVALVALRCLRAGRQERGSLILLVLLCAVPILMTWIGSLGRPIFDERYLIAAAPPFYLLCAAGLFGWAAPPGSATESSGGSDLGLGGLMGQVMRLSLATVLLTGMGFLLHRHYYDDFHMKTGRWQALASSLHRLSAATAPDAVRIAQNYPDPTLWYYYRGDVDHIVLPPRPNDRAATIAAVQELVDRGIRRVILVAQPAANWDATGLAAEALAKAYILTAVEWVGDWPLYVYERFPETGQRDNAGFRNGVVPLRVPRHERPQRYVISLESGMPS